MQTYERLLVTGGCGFIGCNFVDYWFHHHPEGRIIIVDALTYAGDERHVARLMAKHPGRIDFHHVNITNRLTLHSIMKGNRPDAVVNFAAESHNSRAILDPTRFVETNVIGTQALLEMARTYPVSRFHHISTCEVYGDMALDDPGAFTEESPYRPLTPYNASKAAADHLVRVYHHTYGIPVTISNCCNNYGPWQFPEKMIPLFITNLMDGQPMTLYRSSQNRREWLHVEDHCAAITAILEGGRIGETYNIGSGDEYSIEAVADRILGQLQRRASLKQYVPDRPQHDRRYLLDSSKLRREIGWAPRLTFKEGLFQTVNFYLANRGWWEPLKQRLPVDETKWSSTPQAQPA